MYLLTHESFPAFHESLPEFQKSFKKKAKGSRKHSSSQDVIKISKKSFKKIPGGLKITFLSGSKKLTQAP